MTLGVVALSFFSFFCCLGQDPGTVIDIKLSKNGKKIDKELAQKYKVLFHKTTVKNSSLYWEPGYEYVSFSDSLFHVFYWGPYCHEILELTILYHSDTMTIRIKMDTIAGGYFSSLSMPKFYLEIPFQKGYYELSNFIEREYAYTIKDEFLWKQTLPQNRKFEVNEK